MLDYHNVDKSILFTYDIVELFISAKEAVAFGCVEDAFSYFNLRLSADNMNDLAFKMPVKNVDKIAISSDPDLFAVLKASAFVVSKQKSNLPVITQNYQKTQMSRAICVFFYHFLVLTSGHFPLFNAALNCT